MPINPNQPVRFTPARPLTPPAAGAVRPQAAPRLAPPTPAPVTPAPKPPRQKREVDNDGEHIIGATMGALGGGAAYALTLMALMATPARWMIAAAGAAGAAVFGVLGWFSANHDDRAGGVGSTVGGIVGAGVGIVPAAVAGYVGVAAGGTLAPWIGICIVGTSLVMAGLGWMGGRKLGAAITGGDKLDQGS